MQVTETATLSPLPFHLYLFGPFRLESESHPIRLPTRKVEALLAYLALHPQPHPREKLAALFWGDTPDAQARASLRNALPTLRRLIHPELLLADRQTIQLNPTFPLWLDTREFETTISQSPIANHQLLITLYQGDLLADFYDEWLVPEREYYRARYLEALLQQTRELRTHGEYRRAISAAQTLLALEPTSEAAHQQVMTCHLALGERDAARRQFDACRRLLWEELGVEPGPDTLALYDRIQHNDAAPPSPDAWLTNLPVPLTSFIGRETEINEITHQLTGTALAARLLTLTGPGGSGKTRLAIQAGNLLTAAFADGVWWVELAPLSDPTFVPQAVAKVLNVREQAGQVLSETLQNALRSKKLLLVLDNCEHLIAACAELVAGLLPACPHLQILATSREPLALAGEAVWPVSPLSLPQTIDALLPEQLTGYEALRLFAERAAAVQPAFTLTPANAPAVVSICRRLDGLPLAIELAAALVRVLTPPQIAERLVDRFNLLTGGSRAALPRHQTLRAAIDWSYDLLDPAEQALFRRLSVFAGGFTLEAVEAIWLRQISLPLPGPPACPEWHPEPRPDDLGGVEGLVEGRSRRASLLDLLTRLLDKSLLSAEAVAAEMRYGMLETIRQYGQEKLAAAGEETGARRQHLRWYTCLAEQAETHLLGAKQITWLNRLDLDHDNLSAALRWAAEGDGQDVAAGLRLGGALWRYWDRRGYLAETRQRLGKLLVRPEALNPEVAPARAKALYSVGIATHLQGDDEAANGLFMESLAIWQRLGEAGKLGAARAAHAIAFMALRRADYPTAHIWYTQCLSRYRDVNDRWGLAEAKSQLGTLALREGDAAKARALQEEALVLKQALGDLRGIRFSVWALGNIARLQADYATARTCYAQALTTAQEMDDKWSLPYCIEAFGYLAVAEKQPRRAAVIFATAVALRQATGAPLPAVWHEDYDQALTTLRETLGEAGFQSAWAEGMVLRLGQAIAFALSDANKWDAEIRRLF